MPDEHKEAGEFGAGETDEEFFDGHEHGGIAITMARGGARERRARGGVYTT